MSGQPKFGLLAALGIVFTATCAFAGSATPPDQPPAADRDPSMMSADFWQEWQETKSGEAYRLLTSANDCGCTDPAKKSAGDEKQKPKDVVDILVTQPADAAKLMGETLGATQDTVQVAALKTVLTMRIPPQVQEAAVAEAPVAERQRIERFRATLSTGIPGLPGIYLGDTRPPIPPGYQPVAGGSGGCVPRN